MNDADNYFKAICLGCGVNVETPNELYDQSVNCPACGKSFLARPNEKISEKKSPWSGNAFPPKFTDYRGAGLTCPFCKSQNIGEGKMKLTTGGVICVIIGILTIFALIGIVFLLAGNRMREMKYECQNCRKEF